MSEIGKNLVNKVTSGLMRTGSVDSKTMRDMSKLKTQVLPENKKKKEEPKEATGAASAGSFSAPLFGKKETKEGFKAPKMSMFSDEANGYKLKSEEKLKGGLADNKTLEQIAKKHDKKGYYQNDNMMSTLKKQLQMGVKVEMEHTEDKSKAKEIAMDHLYEDPNYYSKLKKMETKEATGSGSSGSYETPAFVAKDSKNWRGAAKPQIPGGKFVKVKKKCKTFPYCNQGDINALKIYENKFLQEAIKNVKNKTGLSENTIKAIIQHEYEEKILKLK
jgi:hypothetical protein